MERPLSLGLDRRWPCCRVPRMCRGSLERTANHFCAKSATLVVVVLVLSLVSLGGNAMSVMQMICPGIGAVPAILSHHDMTLYAISQATRARRRSGLPEHQACVSALAQDLRRAHGRKNNRSSAYCNLYKQDVGHRTAQPSDEWNTSDVKSQDRLTLVFRRRQALHATSICARFLEACPLESEPEPEPEAATDFCFEDMLKTRRGGQRVLASDAKSGKRQ